MLKKGIAIISILFLPAFVLAANEVTVDDNTTLVLPSDGSEYTMKASSQYDTMTVSNDSFAFTLSQAGRVTLISSDRKKITHDAAGTVIKAVTTCESSQSTIDVSIDPPFTTTTINITPSGTCSSGGGGGASGGGGGGGGGGGSGGGSYQPASAPAQTTLDKVSLLKKQITDIQGKIAQKIGTSVGISGGVSYGSITKDLDRGVRGDEVRALQQMLAADVDIYPDGLVTGYYGPLTAAAVKKFQAKHGLPQVGRVGPMTRKKLDQVYGLAVAVQTPVAPVVPTAPVQTPAAPAQVSPDLLKSIQEQIKTLQVKLIQQQIKLIQEKIGAIKQ